MKDFDVIIYQEAIQSEIMEMDDKKINTLENGKYSQDKANKLWGMYLHNER